jgi:hypothetical protein
MLRFLTRERLVPSDHDGDVDGSISTRRALASDLLRHELDPEPANEMTTTIPLPSAGHREVEATR